MIVQNGIKALPEHAVQVFSGHIFDVWQWQQELYDGSYATFERLKRRDTVHTVGVLPDKRILLAEDTQPDRAPVLTPPGGMIDPGETPEQAARREFLEETGYSIGELVPWHQYRPTTKIEWNVHAFIGRRLEKKQAPAPEAGEKIKVLTFTFEEFLDLGHHPDMRDMVIRIMLLEAKLDAGKRKALKNLLYGT